MSPPEDSPGQNVPKVKKVKTDKVPAPAAQAPTAAPAVTPTATAHAQQPITPDQATPTTAPAPTGATPAAQPTTAQPTTTPTPAVTPTVTPPAPSQAPAQPAPAPTPTATTTGVQPRTKEPTTTPAHKTTTTPRSKVKKTRITPAVPKPFLAKGKVQQFRYRTRLIKGSFLPILMVIFSAMLLNKYLYEYEEFFDYNLMLIIFGFLLGLALTAGITTANIVRAKNNIKKGIELNVYVGIGAFIPFLVIVLFLALFYGGIAAAWQFAMGYFIAAIFPFVIVIIYEIATKYKFFIHENPEAPSEGRRLFAVPS